jgi:hypothetical protein
MKWTAFGRPRRQAELEAARRDQVKREHLVEFEEGSR